MSASFGYISERKYRTGQQYFKHRNHVLTPAISGTGTRLVTEPITFPTWAPALLPEPPTPGIIEPMEFSTMVLPMPVPSGREGKEGKRRDAE